MEPNNSTNNTLKVIETIGAQWPFLLTLIFGIALMLKWKTIWSLLGRTSKVKIGGQELEFQSKVGSTENPIDSKSEQPIEQTPRPDKKSHQEIAPDGKEKKPAFVKIIDKIKKRQFAEAQMLFKSYEAQTNSVQEKVKWKLYFFYLKAINGDQSALSEITGMKSIVEANDMLGDYYQKLGKIYSQWDVYEKAIHYFELALKHNFSSDVINDLWNCHYENDKPEKAYDVLINGLSKSESQQLTCDLLISLGTYFEKSDEFSLAAASYERALEIEPNNLDIIFATAFNYSRSGGSILSIGHYMKFKEFSDSSDAPFNNLAVALKEAGLTFTAVDFYKRAINETKSSLATSNLANLYMGAGFKEEANDLIRTALESENIHENIWTSKKNLESKTRTEKEKLETLLTDCKTYINYVRQFANKYFEIDNQPIEINIEDFSIKGEELTVDKVLDMMLVRWTTSYPDTKHSMTFEQKLKKAGIVKYTKEETGSTAEHFQTGYYMFNDKLNEIAFFFLNSKNSSRITAMLKKS